MQRALVLILALVSAPVSTEVVVALVSVPVASLLSARCSAPDCRFTDLGCK